MATGYVTQPHGTGSGGGTSKITVNNSNGNSAYAIQWRYLYSGVYSPFFEQNTTRSGLAVGSYTIDIKMKTAGSPHTPPPDEAVSLASNEQETLTVSWT
jgi:hypothetical protein